MDVRFITQPLSGTNSTWGSSHVPLFQPRRDVLSTPPLLKKLLQQKNSNTNLLITDLENREDKFQRKVFKPLINGNRPHKGSTDFVARSKKKKEKGLDKILGSIKKSNSALAAYYTPQIHPVIKEEIIEIDQTEFMLNDSDSSDETCKQLLDQLEDILRKRTATLVGAKPYLFSEEQNFKIQLTIFFEILYRCFQHHTWETNLKILLKKSWCFQCELNLKKCQQFAQENNGTVLNEFYSSEIMFKCDQNHSWNRKWCAECKRIEREKEKEYLKELERKHQMECKMQQVHHFKISKYFQQQLFEEERKALLEEEEYFRQLRTNSTCEKYEKIKNAYREISRDVIIEAERLTQQFQAENQPLIEYESVLEVYKMLVIPEYILEQYYCALNYKDLKQEYKKSALHLHPDKNRHPQAIQAFQKVNRIYEQIKQQQKDFMRNSW